MTLVSRSKSRRKRPKRWFEKIMTTIALVNLGLVAFDYTYIPFRDIYLKYLPEFTAWYGENFKGIEPHRLTDLYLEDVQELGNLVAEAGLNSPEVETKLSEISLLSREIIDEDPFQTADKSGTLERIKNRMREYVGADSSKAAFDRFWSVDYLAENGLIDSFNFFNEEIAPLVATNYYRGIGENGQPRDDFWIIDQPFVILFAVELALRSLYISRRYKGTNWLDAVIWRWYDIFLLLPFWRWLRIIPVVTRINQSNLFDLSPVEKRIRRAFVTHLAIELTEIVIVRTIDQLQNLLREGELAEAILNPNSGRQYIDLNGVDEVSLISQQLTKVLVEQVLPNIKPQVDAVLGHTVTQVVEQLPGYKSLSGLPGMHTVQQDLIQQLVSDTSSNAYGAVRNALQDEKGGELMRELVQQFGDSFRDGLKKGQTMDEIQSLLNALLDEVKVNYVQSLADEDFEELREQTNRIYEITQTKEG